MEKKINSIESQAMFLEVISMSSKEKLFLLRGGSPQAPQLLFVGDSKELSQFLLTM